MKPIRVGVIGAGVIVRDHHLPILRDQADRFKVQVICDKNEAAAQSMASLLPYPVSIEMEYKQLCGREDVDLVLVAVPPFLSVEVAVSALEAGKHVLSEKPMGNTEADARRLLEVSLKSRGKLMIAEQFFFVRAFQKMAEFARSGDWPFGSPSMVTLHQFSKMTPKSIPQYYYSSWRHDERLTHGYLIEGGCHWVNPIREAFGMPMEIQSRMHSVDSKLGRYDTLVSNCLFEGGILGQLTMTYGLNTHSTERIEVHALKGTLSFHAASIKFKPADESGYEEVVETPVPVYQAEWEHFYRVIREGELQQFTPQQAYDDIRFVQMLINAAKVSL